MPPPAASPEFNANHTTPVDDLRMQMATIAARLIAQDGATYATAKQKAVQQVFGSRKVSQEMLPDNDLIEQQVRIYQQLFLADRQPAQLLRLRECALALMQHLSAFNPYLTGAVLNGTAGEYNDIVIQLFADNPKQVAMELLNRGIRFEVGEQHGQETLSFVYQQQGIHLQVFDQDDLHRISAKKSPRLGIPGLQKLIQESQSCSNQE